MATSSPKNSRDKRLHLVFFTDASKTKSTSVSIKTLLVTLSGVICLFSAAGFSLYLYRSNYNLIVKKDDYIRELKSSIAAFAVTSDKTQVLMASDSDPQTELTRRVALEIQNPSSGEMQAQQAANGDDTLANLQSSLSSLSSVNANLARNEKQTNQVVDFRKSDGQAKQGNGAVSAEKALAARDLNSNYVGNASSSLPLTGVEVEQRHLTEFNGHTTVHFQLINTKKGRHQSWMGRVCGVAELSNPTGRGTGKTNNQAGLIAIPSGEPVLTAQNPSNSCADGELVRFSRLRPTELVVPARQDTIKRVTIFFVEAGSNRTLSQRLEF